MSKCACGSRVDYDVCCGFYHGEGGTPKTPEALMRSRYSAYTMANIDYIKKTMRGKPLEKFDELDTKFWAKNVKWLKLKVINVDNSSLELGYVEFIASFIENGQHRTIHEISEFRLIDGRWFYVDGIYPDKSIP